MDMDKVLHKTHHLHCILLQRHEPRIIYFCNLAISHHMKSELALKNKGIWAGFFFPYETFSFQQNHMLIEFMAGWRSDVQFQA